MELNLSRALDILIAQLFPGPPTAAQSEEAADSATGRRAPVAALCCTCFLMFHGLWRQTLMSTLSALYLQVFNGVYNPVSDAGK